MKKPQNVKRFSIQQHMLVFHLFSTPVNHMARCGLDQTNPCMARNLPFLQVPAIIMASLEDPPLEIPTDIPRVEIPVGDIITPTVQIKVAEEATAMPHTRKVVAMVRVAHVVVGPVVMVEVHQIISKVDHMVVQVLVADPI